MEPTPIVLTDSSGMLNSRLLDSDPNRFAAIVSCASRQTGFARSQVIGVAASQLSTVRLAAAATIGRILSGLWKNNANPVSGKTSNSIQG